VKFAEYNDLESAASVISENTCAVIVEPVQGEGGVTPATPEFLRGLRVLCNKFNVLLIVDEVQW
jgi:acetylornithine/succinyldiaminopimelate/putrescine aminotransferase